MNALNLAHSHYLDVAEQTEGRNAREVARAVTERAERLEEYAGATHGEIQAALEGPRSPANAQEQAAVATEMEGVEETAEADQKTVAEAAELLRQGGKDLEQATAGKHAENEAHDGNVAGTAYLGQAGTQTFDAAKMTGTDTVVDKDNAMGVVAHEHEHTLQAKQAADAVHFGESAPSGAVDQDTASKDTVTATDLTEAGAIIAQMEVAPASYEFLSDGYKARLAKVLDKGVTREQVRKFAREEDGLQQYADAAALAA